MASHTSYEANALLTEHFQYTPLSLMDDIVNTINEVIYRTLEAIESGLLSTSPSSLGFVDSEGQSAEETAAQEIEEGTHALETLLGNAVDKNFDKFEIYTLRNIFTIADGLYGYIRLKHYNTFDNESENDGSVSQESVDALRTQLVEARKLNTLLAQVSFSKRETLRELSNAITQQGLLQDPSVDLAAGEGESKTATDLLTTQATFTASQLPHLRILLSRLREAVEFINEKSRSTARTSREVAREERRRYIDDAVKKVVGQTVPAEGDFSGLGEKRSEEEVKTLERVAGRMEAEGK